MRARFHTLGCRLNEAETERWVARFQRGGIGLADSDEEADLVVVNTCAVTREAVRKSRQLLRRVQRANPDAKLVVSGCFATLEPEEVTEAADIALLVLNRDKDRLVEIALGQLGVVAPSGWRGEEAGGALIARGRQRAFVKVQDGCRHRCTFCIVNVARGAERSRPIGEIRAEVARLVGAGIREVALTGVHLGGYRTSGGGLPELIRVLLGETGIERLRIGALEPWALPGALWGLFADPRLMPHLHLPLQSGSDRVLRRMGRRGTTADFARLVEAGREAVPDLVVTSDIMAGFPGEEAADWAATLHFVGAVGLGDLHVFAYSPRIGTPAASWPDQVADDVKQARCRALRGLAAQLRANTLRRFVGRRVPVLVEGRGPASIAGHWSGYTPSYLPVRAPLRGEPAPVSQIVEVSLDGVADDGTALLGRLAVAMGHAPDRL